MTADELFRLPRGRCRYLLIRGELQLEPLTCLEDGHIAAVMGASLLGHARTHRLGTVCTGTGFVLEHDPDTVLGAAVAFIRRDRVVDTPYFFDGPPDLAIEIVSDDRDKAAYWLRGGTRTVVAVDPVRQSVRIHRPSETTNVTDAISIDDIVPGWRLPLAEIFEE
jgi:Uma2 family endonuclease